MKSPPSSAPSKFVPAGKISNDQTDVEKFCPKFGQNFVPNLVQIWSKSGFDLASQSDLEICSRILKIYFFNFEEKTRKFPILFLSPGPPDGGVINNIVVQ